MNITRDRAHRSGPAVASAAGAAEVTLSDSQLRLVRLLADGHTVAEAAASVGFSDRQARRQLRNLWDAVGARNRVQGMVQLARLGAFDRADHSPRFNRP